MLHMSKVLLKRVICNYSNLLNFSEKLCFIYCSYEVYTAFIQGIFPAISVIQ